MTHIVPKKDADQTKLPFPTKYPSAGHTTTMKILPGKNLLLGEANHPESSLRDYTWGPKKIVRRVNLVRMYVIPGSCLAVNEIHPVVMQNSANLRTHYQTDHYEFFFCKNSFTFAIGRPRPPSITRHPWVSVKIWEIFGKALIWWSFWFHKGGIPLFSQQILRNGRWHFYLKKFSPTRAKNGALH